MRKRLHFLRVSCARVVFRTCVTACLSSRRLAVTWRIGLWRVVVARKRETTVAETWASWAATTHQAATAWRIRRRGAREWAIGHTENYVDGTACITVHMRSVHYILSNKTSLNPSARTQGPLQTDLATRR